VVWTVEERLRKDTVCSEGQSGQGEGDSEVQTVSSTITSVTSITPSCLLLILSSTLYVRMIRTVLTVCVPVGMAG
jgi:hypothetical protein